MKAEFVRVETVQSLKEAVLYNMCDSLYDAIMDIASDKAGYIYVKDKWILFSPEDETKFVGFLCSLFKRENELKPLEEIKERGEILHVLFFENATEMAEEIARRGLWYIEQFDGLFLLKEGKLIQMKIY
jgi:hypothetical protein